MTTFMRAIIRSSTFTALQLAWLGCIVAVPLAAAPGLSSDDSEHAAGHGRVSNALIQAVRQTTEPFTDVNAAAAAGYGPFLGCVSGPDQGAMGVHYVNGDFVLDGEIDVSKPEALIYEPSINGLRLVGVEFIVDATTWLARHDAPPVLDGQSFQFVASPNRYALPAFFELHVWAWRDNPNGAFVDWNTAVSCERQ
jgi:hypothetical protein